MTPPIPPGFVEADPDRPWGTGTEPFPGNTPLGARYLDAHGNRAVVQPDGTALVEGLGVGVNAGKPDGEWWPYSPLLSAGPTSAAPWVGDQTAGSAPVEENPAAAPPATVSGVAGTPAPVTLSPTTPPGVTVVASPGGWIVRERHALGQELETAWASLADAWHYVETHWFRAHR